MISPAHQNVTASLPHLALHLLTRYPLSPACFCRITQEGDGTAPSCSAKTLYSDSTALQSIPQSIR